MELVTIYTTSEMFGSIVKHQGKLIEHGTRKYAQYDNAPFVTFIPKGKRKAVEIQKSYRSYLIIVRGYETPDPDSMFGVGKVEDGVVIRKSRYSSFDDNYKTDFNKVLDSHSVEIIADYRQQ